MFLASITSSFLPLELDVLVYTFSLHVLALQMLMFTRKSVDYFACSDIVWFCSGKVLSSSIKFRSSSYDCSSSCTLWSRSLLICDVVRFF